MHYLLLITLSAPADAKSTEIRTEVYERLMHDDSFCGQGGRFGSPLCDWFVIGGRWSGHLSETLIGDRYRKAVTARFPDMAAPFVPQSMIDARANELDELWRDIGCAGQSPFTRSTYASLGYHDDAMPLTRELYDALLAQHEGLSEDREHYCDLDYEDVTPDFIGQKWLIVVDYHR